MPRGQSLYHEYPKYRVDLEPNSGRVRATCGGVVIADSDRTLTVRETKHDPVVYFPRQDVSFDLLRRTDHETFCPFKGEASYWTLKAGESVEENVAWSYEDPFEQVEGLRDYVAFYSDRVKLDADA